MADDDADAAKESGSSGGVVGFAKRWFLSDQATAPAEGDAPQQDDAVDLTAAISGSTDASVPTDGTAATQPTVGSSSIADADFATIYTRLVQDGDPNTDAVLETFEGMDGMPDDQRRKAISAMLKGMRANVSTIAQTASRRQKAVQQVAAHVRGEMDTARQERAVALTTLETETRTSIAELQAQIAAKQAALDAETKRVSDANAETQGKQAAHEHRAKAEDVRLGKFTEFLRSLNAPAASKE